ncbi:DcrB-related protein [Escherichia coli]|nr:DcrB-related protein [Escherichia coli]
MQFTFNEGHIQLPSQWQDQSMQVLVSTDNSGINLVITCADVCQLSPFVFIQSLTICTQVVNGLYAVQM